MYTVYVIGTATHQVPVAWAAFKTQKLALKTAIINKAFCAGGGGYVLANAAGMVTHQTGPRGGFWRLAQPQPLSNFS